MTFPPGRYTVLESIEVSPEHILEVSSKFVVVHSRAVTVRGTYPPINGALICILVAENAKVTTHRNGRTKIIKEGE